MAGTTTENPQIPEGMENALLAAGAAEIVSASLRARPMDSESVPDFLRGVFAELKTIKDGADAVLPQDASHEGLPSNVAVDNAKVLPLMSPAPEDFSSATLLDTVEDVSEPEAAPPPQAPVKKTPKTKVAKAPAAEKPAAPKKRGRPSKVSKVDDSIQRDVLICLEDGRKIRGDMAEHLRTKHDTSPEEYRKKWGLPASYPMLAPDQIAKKGVLYEVNPKTGALIPAKI